MTVITFAQTKLNFRNFINDWYADILADSRADLGMMAANIEYTAENLVTHAKLIDQFEIDRDKIQTTLNAATNLYDLLALVVEILSGNDDYPFYEQEKLIMEKVFYVKMVNEDDIVELERGPHLSDILDKGMEVDKMDDYLAGEMLTGV